MANAQELLNAQKAAADRGRAGAWSERNKQAFGGLLDINQYLPVTGDIQSGILAAQDVGQGAYGSAALNALGLLPFVPAMGGTIKKAGKAAKTQYELAMDTAQKNAAKPISEGGLGLPANNTAMDRAKALGYNTKAYRGTTADESIAREKQFITESTDIANSYAGYVNPEGIEFPENFTLNDFYNASIQLTPNGNVMPLLIKNADLAKSKTLVPDYEMISGAPNIRSRFAAFDPFRRNEPDLLAGIGGASLAGLLGLSLLDQQQYD